MFLGHFAIGFALKKVEPRLSLGTLFAGAMAMDFAFAVLLLFGVEHVRISPGATAVSPFEFYDYPYSHSAVGSFVMAGMAFLLNRAWPLKDSAFKSRASFVLAAAVFSHFVLDLVSHTPDMPLAGNESTKLGFSLWNSMLGTLAVEADALGELARLLAAQYPGDFDARDHGIKVGSDIWRAGLALPLFPTKLPAARSMFHKTKNAMVFGWTPGGVLVAKREARGVHWGTTVNDPAWRLMRRQEQVVVELTSRSANVLRDLVG